MSTNKLSSTEKAAVLLLGFGEDIASEVMKNLTEHEIRKVGSIMSQMVKVEQAVVDEVMLEFYEALQDSTTFLAAGPEFARNALQKALGPRGDEIADEIADNVVRMESVDRVGAPELANLLQAEHPQTMALILAHCEPQKAGLIMKYLPEPVHVEILVRLAYLDAVDPEVVRDLDEHLMQEITKMGSWRGKKLGGSDKVAAILNAMDKENSQDFLDNIEERDPELSAEVRDMMFTFDDLVNVESGGMQALIQAVPVKLLLLACKTASEPVLDHIFANMSERAGTAFKDDLESLGKMRISDVQAAQAEVLQIVRTMEEAGKLVITGKDEDYV